MLQQGNVRVGILQETDITEGLHTRYSVDYFIWVTEAENRHGGVLRWCDGKRLSGRSRGWKTLLLMW